MKRLLLLAICSGLLHAEGLDGWGKLKWGATKAEALDAYKSDGAAETDQGIRIPEYRVGEDAFSVILFFDGEGLMRVTFFPSFGDYEPKLMAKVPDRTEAARGINIGRLGVRIDRLLEDKYGPPSKSFRKIDIMPEILDEWLLSGGNITLVTGFVRDGKFQYRMRLAYERKPKALDKL